MLRSNWGYIFAALIGLTGITAGVGYGLHSQASYADRAYNQAADYTERAANQIAQSCLRLVRSEQVKCLRDKADAYRLESRDKQREYEDLVAQRTSALWTMIMGIAALIGMALSVVGVGLVYTTFMETRRAANAAHDANRPWLQVEVIDYEGLKITNDRAEITADIRITNVGNSPACNVNTWAVLYGERGNAAATLAHGATNKAKEWLAAREGSLATIDGTTIFPNASVTECYTAHVDWDEVKGAKEAQSVFLSYAVGVVYRFGTSTGHSVSSFDVWQSGKQDRAIPIPQRMRHSELIVRILDNLSSYAD